MVLFLEAFLPELAVFITKLTRAHFPLVAFHLQEGYLLCCEEAPGMTQVPVLLQAGPCFSLQKYLALKWGSCSSFKMGAAAAPQEAGPLGAVENLGSDLEESGLGTPAHSLDGAGPYL